MKTLEEKKLLVKMMKTFGQPVDQELVESIRREEELAKVLFKEEIKEEKETPKEIVLIKEAEPLPPPPAVVIPPKEELVKQVVNVLATANANTNIYRDKEIEGMRRTIAEMMQKISTLSWGGGGTGAVRIIDQDDLDKSTVANG